MTHVAVLVPGIMGSELRLGQELIWPGSPGSLVFGYKKMAELMREDLVATDVIRSYLISRQYESLVSDLNACGFTEDADPPTLVISPYDWRKSNRLAARALEATVDRAAGPDRDQVQVSLIAHSMGGLVSRFYLESGLFKKSPGFTAVRRLITLGTPHHGSPLALTAALGQERRLFLSQDQVLQIASDPRYPALYELLPPQGEPFAWDETAGAEYRPLDAYDGNIADALGLVEANLQAAKDLQAGLDIGRRPDNVRYFYFAGTRQSTVTALWLRWTGSQYRVRRLEPEDGGDGTVPTWSAALGGIQGQPVGGEHATLYRSDDLRRTLAALLGKEGVLAAVPERVVEVAVRDRVVEPGALVRASLGFAGGVTQLDGQIRLERATVDQSGNITGFVVTGAPADIKYSGAAAETLGIAFDAPETIGIYRVAFYPSEAAKPGGADELFVQEPTS